MDFSLAPAFNLAQLPYRLFFGNFFWDDVTGSLPNLYCGVFAAALAVLFFAGAFPRREKIAAALLLATMALSCWAQGLNLIWHGFKEPVWFPCRFSFLSQFVFCSRWRGGRCWPGGRSAGALLITAGAGLIWCAGVTRLRRGKPSRPQSSRPARRCLQPTLAVTLLRGPDRRALARAGAGLFALVALIDMTANTVLSLRKFEAYTVSGFESFYDEKHPPPVAAIREQDSGLYRIEKNFMRTPQRPDAARLLGDQPLFLHQGERRQADARKRSAMSIPRSTAGVRPAWRTACSASSICTATAAGPCPGIMTCLQPTPLSPSMKNPFALPLAYVGASAALEIEIDSTDNTFALQNEMLRALVPGTADALVPAAIEFSQSAQGIFLTFTPACDGPVYLAIPGLDEANAGRCAGGRGTDRRIFHDGFARRGHAARQLCSRAAGRSVSRLC